jgi:hypothetical protein
LGMILVSILGRARLHPRRHGADLDRLAGSLALPGVREAHERVACITLYINITIYYSRY